MCVYIQRPQNKTSKTVNNNIIIPIHRDGKKSNAFLAEVQSPRAYYALYYNKII